MAFGTKTKRVLVLCLFFSLLLLLCVQTVFILRYRTLPYSILMESVQYSFGYLEDVGLMNAFISSIPFLYYGIVILTAQWEL